MGLWEQFPYTNFHEMNLNWMLQKMKELGIEVSDLANYINNDIDARIVQRINELLNTVPLPKFPKKVIAIGDSYLDGWTPDGDFESWGPRLARLLGLTVGTDFHIYCKGGIGFVNTVDGENFVTKLSDAAADPAVNPEEVDLVIVGGGFNDQTSALDDILTRVYQFKTQMASLFPNAQAIIADMCWSQQVAYYRSSAYYKQKVMDGYGIGALNNGMRAFADCWKALQGLNSYDGGKLLASDDVHPIAAGQQALARALFSFINTGSYNEPDLKILEQTTPGWLYAKIEGGSVRIFMSAASGDMSAALNTDTGSLNGTDIYIDLPKLPGVEPVSDMKIWGSATALLYSSTDGYVEATCLAGMAGGVVRLYPVALKADGTNYKNMTGISYVQVLNISMSVPRIWA